MKFLGALALLALGLQATAATVPSGGRMYAHGLEAESHKDYRKAVVYYEAAMLADPNDPQVLRHLGDCRYYLGEKAKAVIAYDAYLSLKPGDAQLRAFNRSLKPTPTPSVPPSPTPVPIQPRKETYSLEPSEGPGSVVLSGWKTGIWKKYNLYVVKMKERKRRKLNPDPLSCELVQVTGLAMHQKYLFEVVYVVNGTDSSEHIPIEKEADEAGASTKGN